MPVVAVPPPPAPPRFRCRPLPSPFPAPSPAPGARAKAEGRGAPGAWRSGPPIVGTFYRAPAPDAPPYVKEGDRVEKRPGVLCIIEAMKLMNEIESEVSGIVKKILVQNGEPVECGQPLFLIQPV